MRNRDTRAERESGLRPIDDRPHSGARASGRKSALFQLQIFIVPIHLFITYLRRFHFLSAFTLNHAYNMKTFVTSQVSWNAGHESKCVYAPRVQHQTAKLVQLNFNSIFSFTSRIYNSCSVKPYKVHNHSAQSLKVSLQICTLPSLDQLITWLPSIPNWISSMPISSSVNKILLSDVVYCEFIFFLSIFAIIFVVKHK
ncbi:Hypothetical_protein [Hexamita inflata]|uniref:Hypothetical_protein n=1 Tax=Hexamita inflata TaxID=28002 RepID=A0AA86U1C0_9EUKA|nr:Hypothetical protein HINF_LOCUS15123 [Hexamita inflata]